VRYRTLGSSDIRVSVVGLGSNSFGPIVDKQGTNAIVARALELGVNLIDTAQSYGNGLSEEYLGKALSGKRDEVVLATKVGSGKRPLTDAPPLSQRAIVASCEASLDRLGTDFIDIYYLHFPDPLTPLEESLEAMNQLVRAGKVRQVACSNYGAAEISQMAQICARHGHSPLAVSQVEYNLLSREAEKEIIPTCSQLGMSIIPYRPLASGFLTGKYQPNVVPQGTRFSVMPTIGARWLSEGNFRTLEAYAEFAAARGHATTELAVSWLLANPAVCSVITGATTPAQLAENVHASEWVLTDRDIREIG